MFHAENLDNIEAMEFLPPLKENCLLLNFFSGPDSLQDKTLSSSFLNSLFPYLAREGILLSPCPFWIRFCHMIFLNFQTFWR